MMRDREGGMRPRSSSPMTINNSFVIVKLIVANLLRTTSASFTITPTITYYIAIHTIINTTRINRYTQQYITVTWAVGGRVADMGPISTFTTTINSFLHIAIGIVAVIIRPRSKSIIIHISITPIVTAVLKSIS